MGVAEGHTQGRIDPGQNGARGNNCAPKARSIHLWKVYSGKGIEDAPFYSPQQASLSEKGWILGHPSGQPRTR